MRFTFVPWILLPVLGVGSGEVALPCDSTAAGQRPEPLETITHDISLAPDARARSVESFSGSITLHRGSHVDGDVETETGDLVLERGSEVAGDLSSDSGTIRIDGARVGGRVSTTSADIHIGPDSRLDGGILVDKRNVAGLSFGDVRLGVPIGRSTPPRVIIGARAKVAGVLRFKRKVELLVSESATIGPVEGATPVMFATELPPQSTEPSPQ
jgi:cytoskeletal protein CcmA (bactofilin family)